MLTDDQKSILKAISTVRQQTIAIYAEMGKLVDAEALGFKPREPGAPDITLRLIEEALDKNPTAAHQLLRIVTENDKQIVRLVEQLLYESELRAGIV